MTDLRSLLERGYFPLEVPPAFTTRPFSYVTTAKGVKLPSDYLGRKTKNARAARLGATSIMKADQSRRQLGIPNPVTQFQLAKCVEANWRAIVTHCGNSTLSCSIPTSRTSGRSLTPQLRHKDLLSRRLRVRAGVRYVLKTDIARFYPSIYTHSIPWALHGKYHAKQNKGKSGYGDDLDRYIRNGQDRQTLGVPIGPDTSLVAAEIILCAVDVYLAQRIPSRRLLRHVDDYEVGCTTYSEAERSLYAIREELAQFELALNDAKTIIFELPKSLDSPWVHALRQQSFRSSKQGQRTDIAHFIDKVSTNYHSFPGDAIFRYALSVLSQLARDVHTDNWPLVHDFILQCIAVNGNALYKALSVLIEFENHGHELNYDWIANVLNQEIQRRCRAGHGGEVALALWACIHWGLQIDGESARLLSNVNDSFVALLTLDAEDEGLIPAHLDKSLWLQSMNEEGLYGPMWLLSYEADLKGWLPSQASSNHVDGDPNFSFLKEAGVYFYSKHDARYSVPTGASTSDGTVPLFSQIA